jgi:hypothetical protein
MEKPNMLTLKLSGDGCLVTHNVQTANPLNPYAKLLKRMTAKRNKTDSDFEEIARLEWEAGLYLEDGKIVMPADNLYQCFWGGAKKSKLGKKWQTGIIPNDKPAALTYDGPIIKVSTNGDRPNPELDQYYPVYSHQAMVVISRNRVLRTRPIFLEWSCVYEILYMENIIERREIIQIAQDAGTLIGLCERRPIWGTFGVEVVE